MHAPSNPITMSAMSKAKHTPPTPESSSIKDLANRSNHIIIQDMVLLKWNILNGVDNIMLTSLDSLSMAQEIMMFISRVLFNNVQDKMLPVSGHAVIS